MHEVSLGNLVIFCPNCASSTDTVMVGLTTLEVDREDEDPVLPGVQDLEQMGVVVYPCGDTFCTPCLAKRVSQIINAHENGGVRASLLTDLISCDEHGVSFPEQS